MKRILTRLSCFLIAVLGFHMAAKRVRAAQQLIHIAMPGLSKTITHCLNSMMLFKQTKEFTLEECLEGIHSRN